MPLFSLELKRSYFVIDHQYHGARSHLVDYVRISQKLQINLPRPILRAVNMLGGHEEVVNNHLMVHRQKLGTHVERF